MHYVILALPLPLLPRWCRVLLVASSRSVVAVLHPFVFVFVDLHFASRAPHTPPCCSDTSSSPPTGPKTRAQQQPNPLSQSSQLEGENKIAEKRCSTTQRVDDKIRGYTAICANPVPYHFVPSRVHTVASCGCCTEPNHPSYTILMLYCATCATSVLSYQLRRGMKGG
jgi:hypothetical protein